MRLFGFTLLLLVGCTATKAYPGPERSATELARVYFFSSKGIETSALRVDGTSQGTFDMGLDVLSGEHYANLDVTLIDKRCENYSRSYCSDIVASGSCSVDFTAEAGKEYAIRVTAVADNAYISVEERNSKEVTGNGSCEIASYRIK